MIMNHPRINFSRLNFFSLDGLWDLKIIKEKKGIIYDDKINVPYSVETKLSGVSHILKPDETLIYHKKVDVSSFKNNDHIILNFLAVDQISELYINDIFALKNIGGYLPFSIDIKPFIVNNDFSSINIILKVKDKTEKSLLSRGKQKIKRGNIFYTPTSGIYMPVYIEGVNKNYIKDFKYKTDIDNNLLFINVVSNSKKVILTLDNKKYELETNKESIIKLDNINLWSINNPHLYPITIESDDDLIHSYIAFRKFEIKEDENNIKRFYLNNEKIFIKGVLDQGYYLSSGLTYEDEHSYEKDIDLVKSLGFNTIRKHIKIEAPYFYYLCDKKGVLVFQDFINGGQDVSLIKTFIKLKLNRHYKDNHYKFFKREDENNRNEAIKEFKGIINYLYNHPSIVYYTIFNESWGQFDSKKIYDICLKEDNTRIYDHASGWFDQGIGDIYSSHIYFKRVKFKNKKDINNRLIFLSECGGYSLKIKGHVFSNKYFGYKKLKDDKDFIYEYNKLVELDIIKNIPIGLSGFIYTQLSDVEDEINGFITFDRQHIKIDVNKIKQINDKIHL